MLVKQPQVRIVSKETVLPTGEAVLAFFALIDNGGQIEVRFLGTKPLKASQGVFEASKASVLLLDAPHKASFCEAIVHDVLETVSPYFSLDFLLTAQPPRAPSLS